MEVISDCMRWDCVKSKYGFSCDLHWNCPGCSANLGIQLRCQKIRPCPTDISLFSHCLYHHCSYLFPLLPAFPASDCRYVWRRKLIFTLNLLKTYLRIFMSSYFRKWYPTNVCRIFYFYRKSRTWHHYVIDTTGNLSVTTGCHLPIFMGIDGVMYAGPIADTAAFILAVVFARRELGKMKKA